MRILEFNLKKRNQNKVVEPRTGRHEEKRCEMARY
jgi:hypothetical protein